jgi:hypothetical protein
VVSGLKGAQLFGFASFNRRRIVDTPVTGRRLTGPERALLAGSVRAYRKDKIEMWCFRDGEFVPALTP